MNCPNCDSTMQSRGTKNGMRSYWCPQCPKGENWQYIKEEDFNEETSTYTKTDNTIHIVCDSRRVMSQEDIISQFGVDLNEWEVKSFTVKTSEGYRKDRKVRWIVKNGEVVEGNVDDTGKMLIVPMYHVSLELIRRKTISEKNIDDIFERLKSKNLAPIRITSSQYDKNGFYAIIPIADLHLGLSSTAGVEGNEYNMELAEKYFYDVIAQAKGRLKGKRIKEIIFLVGNDFLNSDNLQNTTEHGTPQDTNTSWFYLIDKAVEMIIRGTNSLLEIAPVKVINVPSNHDRHSMYGVMKAVEQYFRTINNVIVDNRPIYTKYFMLGKNLFGVTHDIDVKRALDVITTDAKEFWSEATHVVWILGHLHRAMIYEQKGIMEVYRIPTVSGNSRWASEKHYVQSDKRTQFFIVDENDGILDVMNVIVK